MRKESFHLRETEGALESGLLCTPPTGEALWSKNHKVDMKSEAGIRWDKTVINQYDYKYSYLDNNDPMGEQVTQQVCVERTKTFPGRDGSRSWSSIQVTGTYLEYQSILIFREVCRCSHSIFISWSGLQQMCLHPQLYLLH